MIRCQDWRLSPSEEIEPLVARERDLWLSDLDWDVRASWQAVEPARRAGTLAGVVAKDEQGHTAGWTSFVVQRDNVQVLAFVARCGRTSSALLDAILESHECTTARAVLFSVRAGADSLSEALDARGFRVEPYRYLATDLNGPIHTPKALRPWAGDGERLARLLERAYAGDATTRAFAPHGTTDEWTEYVVTLLMTAGCGRFAPRLSLVAPSPRQHQLAGAIVVTDLAPGVSHVAQMAVDPDERGRGVGHKLMTGAMSAAACRGYRRMTLLVAGSNRAALSLYERVGFRDQSSFVVAIADRDRLSRHSPVLSVTTGLR